MANDHKFKIVIVGESGVGKTTFVKKHENGNFIEDHIATLGVEVHRIIIKEHEHNVQFDVWDTAGDERLSSSPEGYYLGSDYAIIMVDVTSTSDEIIASVDKYTRRLREACPNIHIMVIGNKCDLNHEDIPLFDFYCEISTKDNHNFQVPFSLIARKLLNIDSLIKSTCKK